MAKGHRMTARELADVVLDAGSFVSWDEPVRRPADLSAGYAAELDAA